ncbi:hypothetical protein AVEN_199878-1 [Araneus ventricosus]|uniref:Reverse transcriptase domain-containing protein n=1 Tax=Araneus ventricosus TaxID=182803 RepID=A0A4Y2KE73_ARAVE|nr:hypothetical protein AVEN_199878-1 [Araneus ventricosus]
MTSQGKTGKEQGNGCPRGSCSGPVLWNLVANNILTEDWPLSVFIQAFADDFVMVIHSDVLANLETNAQQAINQFNSWTDRNGLTVSPDKTSYLLFTKSVASFRITFDRQTSKRQKSLKYLGITVGGMLNWKEHLEMQATKAAKLHQNLRKIAGSTWGISQTQEDPIQDSCRAHPCTWSSGLVPFTKYKNREKTPSYTETLPLINLRDIQDHPYSRTPDDPEHPSTPSSTTIGSTDDDPL